MGSRGPQPAPPLFWMAFLRDYLRASERLARHLWTVYAPDCSTAEHWRLTRIARVPSLTTMEQLARDALTPRRLLAACLRLAPERHRRPAEIVALEQTILTRTDRAGHWR